MIYTEPLPRTENINRLARAAGPFPVTAQAISKTARQRGLDVDTLHFLELFPDDAVFDTPEDFATRSEEIMFLIREEEAQDDETPEEDD